MHGPALRYYPAAAFSAPRARAPAADGLALFADMCRLNALTAIKRAGSGHIGSSFSCLDVVATLYLAEMNVIRLGIGHPDRDVYFSSKGHDAPGHYAVLHALGILDEGPFLDLRRLAGLPGHPEVRTPGIEAATGSLGMGISKGKGIALAKRLAGRGGRVFVLTGDGELQEGQNFEALQAAVAQGVANLTVIVDHNKVQSDRLVEETLPLGDLAAKFHAFGWQVARCDGHDPAALLAALAELRAVADRPRVLIADTVKGRGVSFMEHPAVLAAGNGDYRYHSGAPGDNEYAAAVEEIRTRVEARAVALGLAAPVLAVAPPAPPPARPSAEVVADAYGEALVELGRRRPDLFILDADLANDCRTRAFARAFPDRYLQAGIAEQDMVSTAGGLALSGLLPVVNSFGVFLAARANEQIYANACEGTKLIHVCHYAGLLPAGPGASHQSLRDIALFAALPRILVLQPCNPAETRMAIAYCVETATESCMIRLQIGPSPAEIPLPDGYRLTAGRGVVLADGADAAIFAYGPVMLAQALAAREILAGRGVGLKVVNMPWLNRVDPDWLADAAGNCRLVAVVDDHAPRGGLGDFLAGRLAEAGLLWRERRFAHFAVEGHPACGTPAEALAFHRLDGASLAARVVAALAG
jgi:transketolase